MRKRQYPTEWVEILPFLYAAFLVGAIHESPVLPQRRGDVRQHILNKDPVPRGGIADQHVRDRTHKTSVLQDRAARHECGQVGTTNFVIFFIKFLATSSSSSVGNRLGKVFAIFNASYFEPA